MQHTHQYLLPTDQFEPPLFVENMLLEIRRLRDETHRRLYHEAKHPSIVKVPNGPYMMFASIGDSLSQQWMVGRFVATHPRGPWNEIEPVIFQGMHGPQVGAAAVTCEEVDGKMIWNLYFQTAPSEENGITAHAVSEDGHVFHRTTSSVANHDQKELLCVEDYEWELEGAKLVQLAPDCFLLMGVCFLPLSTSAIDARQRVFFATSHSPRGPFTPICTPFTSYQQQGKVGENGYPDTLFMDHDLWIIYQERIGNGHPWHLRAARYDVATLQTFLSAKQGSHTSLQQPSRSVFTNEVIYQLAAHEYAQVEKW